jgi:hypothetical protein
MKIFVQDGPTGRFFVQGEYWTKDTSKACAFAHIHLAVDFCLQNNLSNASVIVVCEKPEFSTSFAPFSG